MKFLIDSHCLLWWLGDMPLSPAAAGAMQGSENSVLVSAATVWELEIKAALGTLTIDGDLIESVAASGFDWLPISPDHARAAARLPGHHRDPFDRMLIAQALTEGCTLITRDPIFDQYSVSLVRA